MNKFTRILHILFSKKPKYLVEETTIKELYENMTPKEKQEIFSLIAMEGYRGYIMYPKEYILLGRDLMRKTSRCKLSVEEEAILMKISEKLKK